MGTAFLAGRLLIFDRCSIKAVERLAGVAEEVHLAHAPLGLLVVYVEIVAIGFVESLGPGPMRCFIVLDEAHKLAFSQASPAEKLLREGRKFGMGLILASQQPEDFAPVAFANTATKLVFQVSDDRSTVSQRTVLWFPETDEFVVLKEGGDFARMLRKTVPMGRYPLSERYKREQRASLLSAALKSGRVYGERCDSSCAIYPR